MIAAVCHDLDHPGLNNSYQVNSGTKLALRFNDASTLENMHSYLCFTILRKNGCDIFAGMDKGDRATVRKLIIGCIINTDMTYHFSLKNDLNSMIVRLDEEGKVGEFMKAEKDRDILLKTILHVSDISNPCKEFKLSKRWSDAVVKEFFTQGDLERKEGLSISMGCDRETVEQESLSLNFCDFIVSPFFLCLIDLFPSLDYVLDIMAKNRQEWHDREVRKIMAKQTDDEEKEKEVGKWAGRMAGFLTTYESAKQLAEKKKDGGEEGGEEEGKEE